MGSRGSSAGSAAWEEDGETSPLSRKRKSGALDRSLTSPGNASVEVEQAERPLVSATREGLAEMRRRVATVVEETVQKRLAGAEQGIAKGQEVAMPMLDSTTKAYLRAFQSAVVSKVTSMCDIRDAREQIEAENLMEEMIRFGDEMKAAGERLSATRARVARLSTATCQSSLRIAKSGDEHSVADLLANAHRAKRERDAGGPLPISDDVASADGGAIFAGIDGDVLEPKLSLLIGKLSELPGPLKSVLQEIPELTAALANLVQSVEEAMSVGDSRTEELLGKAPPPPLGNSDGADSRSMAVADGEVSHPPEQARIVARETRLQQARTEWEAAGVGALGGIFS